MTVFVIAEAGINHNGKLDTALMLCAAAKAAGADAVKFQLYDPHAMARPEMREMLIANLLSDADHAKVKAHCDTLGIEYMASCFSPERVDFALSLRVKRLKIGSGELTNHALIAHAATTRLPVILSTGMATMDDIFRSHAAFQEAGGGDLALLHCVSNYPTVPEHCNVRGIVTLDRNFNVELRPGIWRKTTIGYSDHSLYDAPSVMAVALGAKIIEKHFTLDRSLRGPDHAMSLEPDGLRRFVRAVRVAEACAGDGDRNRLQPGEEAMRDKVRGRWG